MYFSMTFVYFPRDVRPHPHTETVVPLTNLLIRQQVELFHLLTWSQSMLLAIFLYYTLIYYSVKPVYK